MPCYLEYLTGRLVAAGGRIELRTVTSLDGLAAEAPLNVNCAGLGADLATLFVVGLRP